MGISIVPVLTKRHSHGTAFLWIAVNIMLFLLLSDMLKLAQGQFLAGKEHVTSKAAEQLPPIWCYQCESMEGSGPCVNLTSNVSHNLVTNCPKERRMCMVRRYSYTTSTENSTSSQRMWSLERNCTEKCNAGCIIIGERTKLYACTSCCDTSFCNTGSGASLQLPISQVIVLMSLMVKVSSLLDLCKL